MRPPNCFGGNRALRAGWPAASSGFNEAAELLRRKPAPDIATLRKVERLQ